MENIQKERSKLLIKPDLSKESCTCMYINIDFNNNEILNDFMREHLCQKHEAIQIYYEIFVTHCN